MLRKLTSQEIDKLASRKGVRRIAVLNFLGTVTANDSAMAAGMNLHQDAASYRWNAATVNAIQAGINLAAKPAPTEK